MNLKEIKELIQLIDSSSLTEFQIEKEDMKILMKKEMIVSEVKYTNIPKTAPELAIEEKKNEETVPKEEVAPPKEDENLHEVKSPIVGTFYAAPGPDVPNYVKVGDRIKKDQVLCIVEAMKLMNEITSDVEGEVVEVLCHSGSLVEYGQPLFKIRRV